MKDCLVGITCQVACYQAKSIKMLTKKIVIKTFYLFTNTPTRLVIRILKLLKIISISLWLIGILLHEKILIFIDFLYGSTMNVIYGNSIKIQLLNTIPLSAILISIVDWLYLETLFVS